MNKITATVGLVALGAASIQAQNTAPAAGSQEATKPWSISATLRGFYDDNYATAPKQLERDSFGFEVSPSASLNLIRDQTALGLSYVYSGRWYEDREDLEDGEAWDHSHQLNGKLSHAFSPRFKVDLTDSFVIAQEPELIEPAGAGLSATGLRSEGDVMRNHALGSFSAGITENLTGVIGYANEYYDYDEEGFNSRSAYLDRMEHLGSFNLRAVVLPKTVLVGGYQYEVVDYHSDDRIGLPFGSLNYPAEERNSTSHYMYGGVDQSISPTFNVSLRGGAQYTEWDDIDEIREINAAFGNETEEDTWSPYVDANMTWLYSPGSYAQLGVRHQRAQTDVGFAITPDGEFVPNLDAQSTGVYGSVSHRIFGGFIASAIASYQHNEYDPEGFDSYGEDYIMAGLNLTYEFNRYLALEAGYNFDWLESDVDDAPGEDTRSYQRNRVYVGVRGTY
jgi:hypothetical protein